MLDALLAMHALDAAATVAGHVLASRSGDGDSTLFLLALGPAAGIGFYTLTFLRYRNTDKRFAYEHDTHSDVTEPLGFDEKIGNVRGVRRTSVEGRNSNSPRERLGPGTSIVNEVE